MKWEITDKALESEFVAEVEHISGEDVSACNQCGKCSAGCPICKDMDYSPNQILRLIQLGMREQVLASNTIWMCASCQTCTTRCPMEVDLARVMDSIKLISHSEDQAKSFSFGTFFKDLGKRSLDGLAKTLQMDITSNLKVFSKVYLKTVKDYGRLSEMNLVMNYNINSGFLFSNMLNVPAFLIKRKLTISKGEATRVAKAKRIFEKVEDIEGKKL